MLALTNPNQKNIVDESIRSSNDTEVGVWFLYSSKTGWFQSIAAQGWHLLGSTDQATGGPGGLDVFVVETRCQHGFFQVVENQSKVVRRVVPCWWYQKILPFFCGTGVVTLSVPLGKKVHAKKFPQGKKHMEELGCSTLNFLSGREAEKLNNHGPMKKIFDKTGLDRNGPWNSRFLHLIGRYHGSGSGGSGLREWQLLRIC